MSEPQVSVATAQGYLPASERPQCGNCHLHVGVVSKKCQTYCNHGKFVVDRSGWCTVWLPEPRWLRVNADAAARLGMSSGLHL